MKKSYLIQKNGAKKNVENIFSRNERYISSNTPVENNRTLHFLAIFRPRLRIIGNVGFRRQV